MSMNLDHVANGHFVLGRDVLCEFDYWPLAVSLQQRYARCPLLIRFHPTGTAAPRVWHFSAFHNTCNGIRTLPGSSPALIAYCTATVDAASLGRRLSGAAVSLGHFSSAYKTSPVNRARISLYNLSHQCGDSYRSLHINDDVPCFADEDSYDNDGIVDKIISKRTRVEESLAAEGDDEDGEPVVTHAAARRKVQLLQHYFVKQGFSDNTHASLDACADLIYSRAHASFKPTTRFVFLHRFSIIICSYNQLINFRDIIPEVCYSGQPLY